MGFRYPWLSTRKRRTIPEIRRNPSPDRAGVCPRYAGAGGGISIAQRRQHRAFVKIEEAVLVGADLVDVDVVVAGVDVFANRFQVLLRVGPADDALGDRLLVDEFGRLFEMRGEGQLEEVVAADRAVGPAL